MIALSRRTVPFAVLALMALPCVSGADDIRRESPPSAVHLVGHEDAALLQRVQDVIDDWDPRKLKNPYVDTIIPSAPSEGQWGKKALRRADLNEFIADVEAAEALGKAFFWDMQAGSDFRRTDGKYVGTACASCHYRAGADARDGFTTRIPYVAWDQYNRDPKHPLEFGERPQPYPVQQKATEIITKPSDLDLPARRQRSTPLRVRRDAEDDEPREDDDGPRTPLSLIVGSQGVPPLVFKSLTYGNVPTPGEDNWESEISARRLVKPFKNYKPEWSMFVADQDDDKPAFRQITLRNSPSVFNAGFSDRLFHDGRAESTFNGFSIFGDFDPGEVLHMRRADGKLVPARVAISKAALASQAVGPIVNDVEMSYLGRTFHDLGAKLLDAPVLGYQEVANNDSHLGKFKEGKFVGEGSSYRKLIQVAFRREWWDGAATDGKEQLVPLGLAIVADGAPRPEGPLMEANFSLYWGLSLLLYQASLVSNDSPFDQMMRGQGDSVNQLWSDRKSDLETTYIDRVRTRQPPPNGAPPFPFASGAEVFQRGFRVFMNRGCFECHSGPLMSEIYSREDAAEAKLPIAYTLERLLIPNAQADAIAISIREHREDVIEQIVRDLRTAHPGRVALADRVVLELEHLVADAHGEQALLETITSAHLNGAGFPLADAKTIATRLLALEKTTARFSGNRPFFTEDDRVALAARLGDPVFVEKMGFPPNQAKNRRPLPIQGRPARDVYAFYDLAFYALGVAPPRYDRGNGDWRSFPTAETHTQAVAARVDQVQAATDPVAMSIKEKAGDRYDLTRPEGKLAFTQELVNRTAPVRNTLTPEESRRLEPANAQDEPRTSSAGASGRAYRLQARPRLNVKSPSASAALVQEPAPPAPAANPIRKPKDRVAGTTVDLDADDHDRNPRDTSWFRDLPSWNRDFPVADPAPVPPQDSVDTRRSGVHFFSRTRALVQHEESWGHRKPLLHDNEAAFWGAFKTPTLRNVELTPPYMHNGRLLTLMDVLDFYDRGGDLPADREVNPDKHPALVSLDMSEEDKLSVVFFLMCLTDDRVRREKAPFDHPSIRIVNGYEETLKERVFDLEAVGAGGLEACVSRKTFPSPR